jgi:flagellar hook-associated protein FlgK
MSINLQILNQEVIKKLKKFNFFTNVSVKSIAFNIERGYIDKEIVISQASATDILMKSKLVREIAKEIGIKYSSAKNLKEVLYHEYGHAYSRNHTSKKFRAEFRRLFGGYTSNQESIYDPEIHISEYASKNPDEDFCECFMHFLKWNGKINFNNLPGKEYTNGIYYKMKFIKQLSYK